MIIMTILLTGEPRAHRVIGQTQVRMQPEPRADMHRLAALSTDVIESHDCPSDYLLALAGTWHLKSST